MGDRAAVRSTRHCQTARPSWGAQVACLIQCKRQDKGDLWMSDQDHRHHEIDYIEFGVSDMAQSQSFYKAAFDWEFTDYGPQYAGIRNGKEVSPADCTSSRPRPGAGHW